MVILDEKGWRGADNRYYATADDAHRSFWEKWSWPRQVPLAGPPAPTGEPQPVEPTTGPSDRLRVFLCHAAEDKPVARELYHQLLALGADPWLDQEKILPGQNWKLEISKAIREAHVVIVCLSQRAITKRGYVQKEIKEALDLADQHPEGAIFLVPLRLEPCAVPERLHEVQYVDYFQEKGRSMLQLALLAKAHSEGLKLQAHA